MPRWFAVGCAASPGEQLTETALAIVQIDIDTTVKRSLPVSRRTLVTLEQMPTCAIKAAQRLSNVYNALLHKSVPLRSPVVTVQSNTPFSRKAYRYSYVSTVDVADGPQVHPSRETVAPEELIDLIFDERIRLADGLDRTLVQAMLDGAMTTTLAPLTMAAGLAIRAALQDAPERLPVGALARNA